MVEDLKHYEKRILKLQHRLKRFHSRVNEIKELNKKIARLNKIIQGRINSKKGI